MMSEDRDGMDLDRERALGQAFEADRRDDRSGVAHDGDPATPDPDDDFLERVVLRVAQVDPEHALAEALAGSSAA